MRLRNSCDTAFVFHVTMPRAPLTTTHLLTELSRRWHYLPDSRSQHIVHGANFVFLFETSNESIHTAEGRFARADTLSLEPPCLQRWLTRSTPAVTAVARNGRFLPILFSRSFPLCDQFFFRFQKEDENTVRVLVALGGLSAAFAKRCLEFPSAPTNLSEVALSNIETKCRTFRARRPAVPLQRVIRNLARAVATGAATRRNLVLVDRYAKSMDGHCPAAAIAGAYVRSYLDGWRSGAGGVSIGQVDHVSAQFLHSRVEHTQLMRGSVELQRDAAVAHPNIIHTIAHSIYEQLRCLWHIGAGRRQRSASACLDRGRGRPPAAFLAALHSFQPQTQFRVFSTQLSVISVQLSAGGT